MLRRNTRSISTLVGGDLAAEIHHSEDSVTLGDETNKLVFTDVSATKCIPVDVRQTTGATSANQTNGNQKTQLVNGADTAEFDNIGGEKALKVSVIGTVGGGSGGTAATDSGAYTPTSSQFTPVGGAFDDVSPDALTEGEMGIVRMTSARAMHVAVQNAVSVTGTFWQATQPVSGTVAVTDLSTLATHAKQDAQTALLTTIDADTSAMVTALQLLDNAIIGNEMQVDVITMPTVAVTGTFWQATQPVSATSLPLPTGAATEAKQDTGNTALAAIQTAVQLIDNAIIGNEMQVDIVSAPTLTVNTHAVTQSGSWTVTASNTAGDVAHDSADSGNPIKVGGVARNADPTNVANGDRVNAYFDLNGKQVITPHVPRNLVAQNAGTQSTTTEATMLSAGGAGVFHDVTKIVLTNEHATDDARVQIRDATAGTIRLEMIIAPQGGAVVDFGDVPMCQTTENNNWTIDLNANISTVYWFIQAIKRTG